VARIFIGPCRLALECPVNVFRGDAPSVRGTKPAAGFNQLVDLPVGSCDASACDCKIVERRAYNQYENAANHHEPRDMFRSRRTWRPWRVQSDGMRLTTAHSCF